jgi:hypothetical protein
MSPRALRSAALVLAAAGALACEGARREPGEMRLKTETFAFTITPDVSPPVAREPIVYKVVVRDRESGQPVENGEGQIYSNNIDGARTWDGLAAGPEPGTYYGRVNFVTAGDWAIAVRFRRDSTATLEKVEWMQEIRNARGERL